MPNVNYTTTGGAFETVSEIEHTLMKHSEGIWSKANPLLEEEEKMPNVRPISEKKYGVSKYAFTMTRAYCLQYNEWKQEIRDTQSRIQNARTDIERGNQEKSDPTEKLGQRHAELMNKMELVEDTVMEAVGNNKAMYPYLLKYVTTEDATYFKMQQEGMPYGKTLFYETRRLFYYLLSKKI